MNQNNSTRERFVWTINDIVVKKNPVRKLPVKPQQPSRVPRRRLRGN